jgi:hypothetical protein
MDFFPESQGVATTSSYAGQRVRCNVIAADIIHVLPPGARHSVALLLFRTASSLP